MEKTIIFKTEKELYSIIGKNIRYYRKLYSLNKKELTQESLAEIANVSTSLIGNLESKTTVHLRDADCDNENIVLFVYRNATATQPIGAISLSGCKANTP